MNKQPKLWLYARLFSECGAKRELNQDNFYFNGHWNPAAWSSWEDAGVIEPEAIRMAAVFDGMGGEMAGELASRLAAESMDSLVRSLEAQPAPRDLASALEEYHAAFLDRLDDEIDRGEICGTTCAAVALSGDMATPFWMGDSRILLLREGRIIRLSRDHTVAQRWVDSHELTEEEARTTREWHLLTRFLGRPEANFSLGQTVSLREGDRLLLATDGVTDLFPDEELERCLNADADEGMAHLRGIARREADDNSTLLVLTVVRADRPI